MSSPFTKGLAGEEIPLSVWLTIVSNLAFRTEHAALVAVDRFCLKVIQRAAYEERKGRIDRPGCMHIATMAHGSGSRSGASFVAPVEHHAVLDAGARVVIHYCRQDGSEENAVRVDSVDRFRRDFGSWRVVALPRCREHAQTVMKRAHSRVGETNYNILFNNCEHFANWCFDESETSSQVRVAGATALGSIAAAGTGVLIATNIGAAPTTLATNTIEISYLLGFIPWGTTTATTTTVATYGTGSVVAMGAAVGVAAGAAVWSAAYGLSVWAAYGKQKVAKRLPIYIFNDSDEHIRVTLSTNSGYDSIYALRTQCDVGQMSQTIACKLDGELGPPVPEESFKKFSLQVSVKDTQRSLWSSWTEVCQEEVQRGDVLIFKERVLTKVPNRDPAPNDRSSAR